MYCIIFLSIEEAGIAALSTPALVFFVYV